MADVQIVMRQDTRNKVLWSGTIEDDQAAGFQTTVHDATRQAVLAIRQAVELADAKKVEEEERAELARLMAKYGVKGGIADVSPAELAP